MAETDIDIHGTNWAEHQRVFKIERDAFDPKKATLFFAVPLRDGEVTTLLEHLRTWHP